MKRMVLFFLWMTILGYGFDLLAQKKENPDFQAHLQAAIASSLNIDAAKAASAVDILQRYSEQTSALQARKFSTPQNKQQAMSSLQKAQNAELKDLLGGMPQVKSLMDVVKKTQNEKNQEVQALQKDIGQSVQKYMLDAVFKQVVPVRQGLEAKLSASEQAKISALRTDFQAAKRAFKQQQRTCKKIKGKNTQEQRKQCKMELDSKQDALKAVMARQKALLDALQAPIETALAELKPQKEVWETEIKNILKSSYSPQQQAKIADSTLTKQAQQYLGLLQPQGFLMLNADNLDAYLQDLENNEVLKLMANGKNSVVEIEHLASETALVVAHFSDGTQLELFNEASPDELLTIDLDLPALKNRWVLLSYQNSQNTYYIKAFLTN